MKAAFLPLYTWSVEWVWREGGNTKKEKQNPTKDLGNLPKILY